jgi:hypothetical protein
MNEELKRAAEEILAKSAQSQEYKRRILKLLENVTTSNFTDADVRQVIELTAVREEE